MIKFIAVCVVCVGFIVATTATILIIMEIFK